MEEEIRCPRYLIRVTGEGAAMLGQKPDDPLPLRQLIFLNRNDDIHAWFLANKGHDPLDLMVLESRREDGEALDETPEPPNGRYRYCDRDVWVESAGGEDSVRECNDPTIGSYNHYHLSPNGIPSGIQRWYGLVYIIHMAGNPRIRPRE